MKVLKKAFHLFLLIFYCFGTFCLPMGDFFSLTDLPAMYRHCKATEDKDMTPFDFITDHLINIDCLFDKHNNGDEQKPHAPVQFRHQQAQNYFTTPEFKVIQNHISVIRIILPNTEECNYSSSYLPDVFRPPIV